VKSYSSSSLDESPQMAKSNALASLLLPGMDSGVFGAD